MEFIKNFEHFSVGGGSYKVKGVGNLNGNNGERINLKINGDITEKNQEYRGMGCVISDLGMIMDYKSSAPESYNEILKLLFSKNYGACFNLIKRNESEKNSDRIKSEVFVSDAVEINSEITSDITEKTAFGRVSSNLPHLSRRKDRSGISGEGSSLSMAKDIITAFNNDFDSYVLQEALAFDYNSDNDFLTANLPWNKSFYTGSGFYVLMHFTRFADKGWKIIKSDNKSDAVAFMPEDKSEITVIIANNSRKSKHYLIELENCDFNGRYISKVETKGANIDLPCNENWFRLTDVLKAENNTLTISVKPNSVITLTTRKCGFIKGTDTVYTVNSEERLPLDYSDSFSYSDCGYRKSLPKYISSVRGDFEICNDSLIQTAQTGEEYACALFGDAAWSNYQAEIKVKLKDMSENNFAGLGVKVNKISDGFAVKLYSDGKYELIYDGETVKQSVVENFKPDLANKLKISVVGNLFIVYLNDSQIDSYTSDKSINVYGRVSIISAYFKNEFTDFRIYGNTMRKYADRTDALSEYIKYTGELSSSVNTVGFTNNTYMKLQQGNSFKLKYEGCGFALCGEANDAVITVYVDGQIIADKIKISSSSFYRTFFRNELIPNGSHKLTVTVNSGVIKLDSIALYSDNDYRVKLIPFPQEKSCSINKTNVKKTAAVAAAGITAAMLVRKITRRKK